MFWNLGQESLIDPQQMNSYSYARDNPINMKDPSGNVTVMGAIQSFLKSVNSFFNRFSNSQQQTQAPAVSQNNVQKTTPWMKIAESQLGVKEISGSVNNPKIMEYHSATNPSPKTDEAGWCSSFANWTMKQVGIEGTNNATASSWGNWGQKLDVLQ